MDFQKLKAELDKRDLSEIPTPLLATLLIKLMELESQPKLISAKNSIEVANASKDFQKIKTAEFEVPVIYAGVLHYNPGELGSSSEIGREGADVYYSPESISDPEYLETIKRSPISVGTHDKNTGEFNRDIDGWPTAVWYDDKKGCVMVKGYVVGEDNVAYVEQNRNSQGFGSSAFIDFLGVKKESGVTPSGKSYTAKTTKLVNNHIALLPNIRDSKNVILAMNAIKEDGVALNERRVMTESDQGGNLTAAVEYFEETDKSGKKYFFVKTNPSIRNLENKSWPSLKDAMSEVHKETFKNLGNLKFKNNTGAKNMEPVDKEAVKTALNEMKEEETKKSEWEEMKNAIKGINERLDAYDAKAKNAPYEGKETPKEEAEEKKVESENAMNALPSQELIKDISEHYGISFAKTPTIMQLGAIAGIKGKSFDETLSALNAKRAEIKKPVETAVNSNSQSGSFKSLLDAM